MSEEQRSKLLVKLQAAILRKSPGMHSASIKGLAIAMLEVLDEAKLTPLLLEGEKS